MESLMSWLGEIDVASIGRALLFLGIPFILMVFFLQWKWAKTCDKYMEVLVAQMGGGGKFMLAPKEGGQVTIINPITGEGRTWPVNELATIDVTYPGVGFVPKFLQKKIRLAILNEGDWEPMLNRSPHRRKVASPDVMEFIRNMVGDNSELKAKVEEFLNGVSTGSTREMIADPATLYNLQRSSVMQALATVSNDLIDTLKDVNTKLARFTGMRGVYIYIGLGVLAIMLGFAIFLITEIANYLGVGLG